MADLQTTLTNAVNQINTDSGLLHDVVHGSDTETVTTEGGSVKTVAKAIKDIGDQSNYSLKDFSNITATGAEAARALALDNAGRIGRISSVGVGNDQVRTYMLQPINAAAGASVTTTIFDVWQAGNWRQYPRIIITNYETGINGGYARYYWAGNASDPVLKEEGGNHATFTVTDHGVQEATGNHGRPTYRRSLNFVVAGFDQGFVIIDVIFVNSSRIYGNDQANTEVSTFGNAGGAVVFKTLTNAQVAGGA